MNCVLPKIGRAVAIATALVLLVLALPRDARADDAVDNLAKVLDIAGTALPTVPVSGQDVRESRSLFKCIDNAGDDIAVVNCLYTAKDTSVGKKVWQQSGLPSWIWKLIDVYIDVREGDFWELVADVGMAVACAVANGVFAVDVCGVAQAIIETIDDVADAFADAWEFIEDIGSAIADVLGFGGGSDGPPLWAVLYKKQLQPYVGNYAHDWLTDRPKFVADFDVTGKQPKSLLCTISQSYFKKSCAWLFSPPVGIGEQSYKPWYRDSLVYAVNLANAAAQTQGIATIGVSAAQWRQFRDDWTIYRSQADRLRRGYAVASEVILRLQCGGAADPWRVFLNAVKQPAVAADANKVLAKSTTAWKYGETTTSFCSGYAAGIKPEKIKSCEIDGNADTSLLPLECSDYDWAASCKSMAASGYVTSTKFPPALKLTCGVDVTMADVDLGKDIVAQLGKNAQGQMACELGETLSAIPPPSNSVAKPVVGGVGKPAANQKTAQPKNPMLTVVCRRDLKKARCDELLANAKKKHPKTAVSCALKYLPEYAAQAAVIKQKVAEFNVAPSAPIKQPGGKVVNIAVNTNAPKFEIYKLDPLRVKLVPAQGATLPPTLEQSPHAKSAAQLLSQNDSDCADPEIDGVEKPALCAKPPGPAQIGKPELTAPVKGPQGVDPTRPVLSGGLTSPAQGAAGAVAAQPGLVRTPITAPTAGAPKVLSGPLLPSGGAPNTRALGTQTRSPLGNQAPAMQAPQTTAPTSGGFNLPQPAPAQIARTPSASDTAEAERMLAPAGCTRIGEAANFSCATRSGFDRCESLRKQQKVSACSLAAQR
jgi:hypothetical protein